MHLLNISCVAVLWVFSFIPFYIRNIPCPLKKKKIDVTTNSISLFFIALKIAASTKNLVEQIRSLHWELLLLQGLPVC